MDTLRYTQQPTVCVWTDYITLSPCATWLKKILDYTTPNFFGGDRFAHTQDTSYYYYYSRRNVVPAAIQLPGQIDGSGCLVRLWLLRMVVTFPLSVTRRRSSNGRSDEHDCLREENQID
jgi:hypothetical protein